jgi:hypothetical protein
MVAPRENGEPYTRSHSARGGNRVSFVPLSLQKHSAEVVVVHARHARRRPIQAQRGSRVPVTKSAYRFSSGYRCHAIKARTDRARASPKAAATARDDSASPVCVVLLPPQDAAAGQVTDHEAASCGRRRRALWFWPPVGPQARQLRVTVSTLWEAAWALADIPGANGVLPSPATGH